MGKNTEWQHSALALDKTGVLSRRQIAEVIGVARSTCLDFLREYGKFKDDGATTQEVEPEHDNSRILVISDLHAPYCHPNTLQFLQMLKDRYNPTRIISVGDEQDVSASSFHDSDPDLLSAGHELVKAQLFMQELYKMFPRMDIMSSNHGDLYYRKAKHHGIPLHVIKSYNDVLRVGDGWKWHNDLTIELPNGQSVYFCHGKAANGLKLSQSLGMSCVQGHYHNSCNIQYWSSPRELHWSMQVGCLIDDKSLAMAYNKLTVNRPIISCGLIIDSVPVLEMMPL